MIIGQAIKEKIGGDFTDNFLSRPMERIKKFSRLSCMFLGTQPEMRNYYRNPFVTFAFDEQYEKLKIYEDLLGWINFSEMKKKDREEIKERIKSFEPCQSWPLRIEFDFLHWLRTNNNITQDRIRYRDFKDSEHDFKFEVNNTEFNAELTSLGQSKPSKEIEEALYLIAENLIDSIPYGKGLIMKVNTEILANKNNRMEKEHICKFLTEEIKKIHLIILIKHEGFCLIPKDLKKMKEILCDEPLRKAFSYQYKGWFERMALLQNTNDGREYLEKVSLPSELSIMSFSWRNNQRPIKYIILDGDFNSEDKRREFLLGRLEERIRAKLAEKQLAGQMNPIIAVLFNDFVFHHYADNNYPVGNDFQRIQERILNVVKDNGNKEIKGILLIEDFKENIMRFIPNPNIEVPRDLLNIIELFISRKN